MVIESSRFQCRYCGEVYDTLEAAERCEKLPVENVELKIDDMVRLTSGDGKGERAKITRIFIYSPFWGGSRYAHKIGYQSKLIDSFSSRQLIQGEGYVRI